MTFREFMQENGYELQTTFGDDFSIADRFGLSAIQDTFNRAFEEWKITTNISQNWYWYSITRYGNITRPDRIWRYFTIPFGLRQTCTRRKI